MKPIINFLLVLTFIIGSSNIVYSQNPEQMYQKALVKEEGEGALQEAIKLYQQVADNTDAGNSLQAKALLHVGLCYEKLGKQEALKAYQRLVNNFPGQKLEVAVAKERLSRLTLAAEKLAKKDAQTKAYKLTNQKIWDEDDTDLDGAISPDGKYLSYVDWDTGDLAVYEIATGKKRRLTNKGSWKKSSAYCEYSRWFPDSKKIVYLWFNEEEFAELRTISLDNLEPVVLMKDKELEWAVIYDCSPDGKYVLTCLDRKNSRTTKLSLISTLDGSVHNLKSLDTYYSFYSTASFSPDGQFIVYDLPQGKDIESRDIYIMKLSTKEEVVLVKHPEDDRLLGWVPHKNHILFVSDRTGTPDYWTLKTDNGKPIGDPTLVKSNKGPFTPISLGFTDNDIFYYGERRNRIDVYETEIDPSSGKVIKKPKRIVEKFIGCNGSPDYSEDGKYLAYVSRRPPGSMKFTTNPVGNVLCIRSLETGEEKELKPDINMFGFPRWSPDGKFVMVVNFNGSNLEYYQININTGRAVPVLLNSGQNIFGGHYFSMDGKILYHGIKDVQTEKYKLVARNLEEKSEQVIYESQNRFKLALSPDKQSIATISNADKSLKIISIKGGEPKELLNQQQVKGLAMEDRVLTLTWSKDGEYIYFADPVPLKGLYKWDLYRVSIKDGNIKNLGFLSDGFLVNLNAHPDGRRIVYSARGKSNSEVWRMENFLPQEELTQHNEISKIKPVKPKFTKIRTPFKIPQWSGSRLSPEGKTLAFGSDQAIWTVPIPGRVDPELAGEPKELPGTGNVLGDGLSWSGNGHWIAFSRSFVRGGGTRINFNPEGSYIEVIPSTGGKSKRIPIPQWVATKGDTQRRLSLSHDGKTVAFDAGGQIYAASVETNDIKQLTSNGGISPSFSPDGTKIAYLKPFSSPFFVFYEVWVMSVKGKDSVKVSGDLGSLNLGSLGVISGVDLGNLDLENLDLKSLDLGNLGIISGKGPIWSPDGKMIAFGRVLPDGPRAEICIVTISNQGKPVASPIQIKLPLFSTDFLTGWTPDNKIGLLLESAYHEDVYTVSVLGGKVTQMSRGGSHPRWSPDGKRIYFRKNGISYAPSDGGKMQRLSGFVKNKNDLGVKYPGGGNSISPDGKSIVFSGWGKSTGQGIYTIPVQGSDPKQISNKGQYPCWSPDGDWIAYIASESIDDKKRIATILKIPREGGESIKITSASDLVTEGGFDWSPDGKWIAYFSKEENTLSGTLNLIRADGGDSKEICKVQHIIPHNEISWSPDGHQIAFTSKGKIWIVEANGGHPVKIKTDLNANAAMLDWSPDGKKITFSANSGGEAEFWFMDDFLPLEKFANE